MIDFARKVFRALQNSKSGANEVLPLSQCGDVEMVVTKSNMTLGWRRGYAGCKSIQVYSEVGSAGNRAPWLQVRMEDGSEIRSSVDGYDIYVSLPKK